MSDTKGLEERAGWEIEGFIDRLTKRNDTNDERLVLETISHLRGFSRDCDSLRDALSQLRSEREAMETELRNLVECLELAKRNGDDLPLPFAGYGWVHVERARDTLDRLSTPSSPSPREEERERCSPTETEIEAATRVFCNGLPIASNPKAGTLAGVVANGRCWAPDCGCWEQGKQVTRAALEAAAAAIRNPETESGG